MLSGITVKENTITQRYKFNLVGYRFDITQCVDVSYLNEHKSEQLNRNTEETVDAISCTTPNSNTHKVLGTNVTTYIQIER